MKVFTGKINIDEAEEDQSNLLKKIVESNNKSRPKKTKKVRLKAHSAKLRPEYVTERPPMDDHICSCM